MRPIEIEQWTLRVVERVKSGQPNEDARVELKATWPTEHQKAARRIAGHANAARGEPILWVIGVDPAGADEAARVPGAVDHDLAKWWPAIAAFFDDGVTPDHFAVNVPIDDRTVVAIQFDTDRAPFVVTGAPQGAVQREVPWREGTAIRSARRQDVLRLLAPLQSMPTIESLSCRLSRVKDVNHPPKGQSYLQLHWSMFVVPVSIQSPSFAALHRSRLSLTLEDGSALQVPVVPPFKAEAGVMSGALFINTARMIELKTTLTLDTALLTKQLAIRARLSLWIAGAERAVVLETLLSCMGSDGAWATLEG